MRLSHAPLRVAIGAYILNSGLGKRTGRKRRSLASGERRQDVHHVVRF